MTEITTPFSRRAFLRTTAVAAAVAPVAPMVAQAAPAANPGLEAFVGAAVTAPTPFVPRWRWWYGAASDDDHFSGGFATREEAVAAAKDEGYTYIVEAHQDIEKSPFEWTDHDVYRMFERVSESTDALITEDGDVFEDIEPDDVSDLVARLDQVTAEWFEQRDIRSKMRVWMFQGQRNGCEIPADEGDDT